MYKAKIKLDSYKVFKMLLLLISILLFLNCVGIVVKYGELFQIPERWFTLFDFNEEKNIPTIFSFLLLLISSLLLMFTAFKLKHKKKNNRFYWLGLALIFLFLSLDEMISIHESLILITRKKYQLSGLLYFSWVLPYGIILILVSLAYFRFLIRLPKKTMKLFVLSGLIYVGGALGVELFEGKHYEEYGADFVFTVFYTLEESMEMLGISIFIWALTDNIAKNISKVNIKLGT